jgi:hypothetical protein
LIPMLYLWVTCETSHLADSNDHFSEDETNKLVFIPNRSSKLYQLYPVSYLHGWVAYRSWLEAEIIFFMKELINLNFKSCTKYRIESYSRFDKYAIAVFCEEKIVLKFQKELYGPQSFIPTFISKKIPQYTFPILSNKNLNFYKWVLPPLL